MYFKACMLDIGRFDAKMCIQFCRKVGSGMMSTLSKKSVSRCQSVYAFYGAAQFLYALRFYFYAFIFRLTPI